METLYINLIQPHRGRNCEARFVGPSLQLSFLYPSKSRNARAEASSSARSD